MLLTLLLLLSHTDSPNPMYSPATVTPPSGFPPATILQNPRKTRTIKSFSKSSSSFSSNSTLQTSKPTIQIHHEACRTRISSRFIPKPRVSSEDAQPTVSVNEDEEASEPSFLEFITSERVKVVAMVALALALCNADRVVMSVAIVPLSQSRGWSQAFAGVVQSSFLWGYMISPIAGGTLVDYYGGKIVMACGVALWSMATFLTPWAADHSLLALLTMRALLGVAEGVALPCMNNMIARWFPETERSRAVGLAMAGFQLGSAIGLTLSPILMSQGGVGGPFIIFGLSGFLWVLVWVSATSSTPERSPQITKYELEYIQSKRKKGQMKTAKIIPPFRRLLSKLPTWSLIVANSMHSWGFFVILSWMPVYFKTIYHVDLRQAAWFSAVPWSMMALVGYLAGVFSDKLIQSGMTITLTRKIMQSIGFVGPGIALIGLIMAKSPVVGSAWLTLAVGLKSFSHCGFLVNLQEIAPQYSGVLHGMSNTAGTLAAIVGTVGAGFFVELVGSFQGFLLLTSLLYFSAALFWNIFSIARDRSKQSDQILLETLAASGIGEMDRISQLPESIVHHILSFCNTPAELIRMSVLSKSWFNLSASFPCLYFNIRYFRTRESFFKYVEYTTSRFCQQNVTATAHRLKLRATLQEPTELDIVNRCLERVLNKGVRELEIDITNSSDVPKYRLPDILLSVSGLESLTIRGCYLPSSFMLDAVHFKSLIQLKLENVPMDDEVIKHLTASCPLLQNFEIRWCHGFKRLCHQNLRKVWIYYNVRVERIDIEAPNLSYLFIEDRDGRGAPRMNVASCRKLTTVSYFGNDFTGFLSQFPFIENLYLATKFIGNSLMLASHSLRTLVLHSNCDLDNIELSTPNLDLFMYSCNPRLLRRPLGDKPGPPVRDLAHLKSCMQCYPHDCIDALWFVKLRLFFDKENGFKVLNLYIRAICSEKLSKLEKLKAIELPPYELEHVELQLDTHEESSAHVAFVDAVLWCCRPRSLTLRSSVPYEEQSDVVKFTFKKLLEQEDQGHTKIQIVSPSSAEAQKHLMDLKSLSMALPCEGKKLSFIKEEVLQEEAGSQR